MAIDNINEEKAMSWIANLFEEGVGNIKPDTKREDIPAWDSLGILTLMARLDEDFDIVLSEEEIQELRTVEDILATLRRNNKLQ